MQPDVPTDCTGLPHNVGSPAWVQQAVLIDNLSHLNRWASAWATWLRPHDTVALWGGLGSGKTTLVSALVQALGLPYQAASPTYTLVHEYTASAPALSLWHSDWYRCEAPGAYALWHEALAWLAETPGVALVEWPDRAGLPTCEWTLHLSMQAPHPTADPGQRLLTLAQPAETLAERGWPLW
jgi:tRNA threonylcarbamoyladenosine biosynthesis protein TsaE